MNKVPCKNVDPLVVKEPVINVLMFIRNPSVGEIEAVAEPEANLHTSPVKEDTRTPFRLLPSPENEPVNEPEIGLDNCLLLTNVIIT
jgi:hypothetical protein